MNEEIIEVVGLDDVTVWLTGTEEDLAVVESIGAADADDFEP